MSCCCFISLLLKAIAPVMYIIHQARMNYSVFLLFLADYKKSHLPSTTAMKERQKEKAFDVSE
jgi:hypothetical protein